MMSSLSKLGCCFMLTFADQIQEAYESTKIGSWAESHA
jgi:hypothetical protein